MVLSQSGAHDLTSIKLWASCQMPTVLHIMPKRVSAQFAAIILEAWAPFMPGSAQDCTAADTPYAGCTPQACTTVNTPYTGCTAQDCTGVDIPDAGCIAQPTPASAPGPAASAASMTTTTLVAAGVATAIGVIVVC